MTAVRVVLDGGDCKLGLESTIVACLDGKVRLLRPGSIDAVAAASGVVGEVLTETVGARRRACPAAAVRTTRRRRR